MHEARRIGVTLFNFIHGSTLDHFSLTPFVCHSFSLSTHILLFSCKTDPTKTYSIFYSHPTLLHVLLSPLYKPSSSSSLIRPITCENPSYYKKKNYFVPLISLFFLVLIRWSERCTGIWWSCQHDLIIFLSLLTMEKTWVLIRSCSQFHPLTVSPLNPNF